MLEHRSQRDRRLWWARATATGSRVFDVRRRVKLYTYPWISARRAVVDLLLRELFSFST